LAPGTPVEVWFHDEMRVGQKGTLTRVWAETGSRPRAPRSDGYQSVYLFGAVCPGQDRGCALILPRCDTAAMTLFLEELSGHVAPGAHAMAHMGDPHLGLSVGSPVASPLTARTRSSSSVLL
jgi:hypothetical protein